jgi:hypothetical protein
VSSRLEGVASACLVVLGCAAVYESLIAARVIPLGSEPGRGATGSGVVFVAALIALLCGAAVSGVRALSTSRAHHVVLALLAPAGAAYVLTRWLSFDPYYLPTLRRYSSGGVSGMWIAVVCLAGIAAAVLVTFRARAGAAAVSAVLVVSAHTGWVIPFGK